MKSNRFVRGLKRLVLSAVAVITSFCVVVVLLQDLLIFPMLTSRIPEKFFFAGPSQADVTLPSGVESRFLQTSDGNRLEYWVQEGKSKGALASSPAVALIFRGNGGTLNSFYYLQEWLSSIGVKSYLMDYPGYGRSDGWPSEEKLYRYSMDLCDSVLKQEELDPGNLIVVGVSIGSGIAAHLAAVYQPRILAILAGYSNFRDVVKEQNFLYRVLSPFLWYELPTARYVGELKNTSLFVAHGAGDSIIPARHLSTIVESYRGKGQVYQVLVPNASHMSFMDDIRETFLSAVVASWKNGKDKDDILASPS